MERGAQGWLDRQAQSLGSAAHGLLAVAKAPAAAPVIAAVWPPGEPASPALIEAARVVLATRTPIVRDEAGAARILALAFRLDDGREGAAAIELAPLPAGAMPDALRRLELGLVWLPGFLAGVPRDGAPSDSIGLDLVATALAAGGFEAGATAIATELATRLGAERVSIGFVERDEPRLVALSHSAAFDARAQLVRQIEDVMAEALDQGRTVVYPAPAAEAAALVRAHEALVRERGVSAACSVALRHGDVAVGALTLELPAGRSLAPNVVTLLEDLAPLLGALLEAQRRADRSLAAHARDAVRAPFAVLSDPARPGARLAAAGVALAVLLLTLLPFPWRVTAPATLEGIVQRVVVAPVDGFVAEARTRAGDVVRRGDVLGTLDDAELRLERRRWEGRRDEVAQQHRTALALHDRTDVTTLGAQLEQAEAELALLDDQLARARLVAPFDGVVAKGDLSQALGSPVARGDVLFEIASLEGYRIILEVDERDIASVSLGQHGRLTLSSLEGQVMPLVVSRVTPVATAADGRNFFRVEAALAAPSDALRPGMQGVAKIAVGRRSLLWIWTHRLVDWLRLAAWGWLP